MLLLKILLILWPQTSLFSQTYTCCNLQDVLWPLIIFSASISVFLLYWIRVFQEVYAFQTRYVLFPLQLLKCSFNFLHSIRSKFLIYQKFLHSQFHIKELGLLNILLGDDSPFFIWYVALSSFPTEHNLEWTNIDGQLLEDPTLYCKLIGYLMYLTITRPDIIYAINILSQFMARHRKPHLDAATCICYLKGSPQLRAFHYGNIRSLWFRWTSCPMTHHYTTTYGIYIGDGPISWKTKKPPLFLFFVFFFWLNPNIVIAMACCELIWLHYLFTNLGFPHCKPTNITVQQLCKFRLLPI